MKYESRFPNLSTKAAYIFGDIPALFIEGVMERKNRATTKVRTHLAKLLMPDYTPPDYMREEIAHLQEAINKEKAKSDSERQSDLLNGLLLFFIVIPLCLSLLGLLVGLLVSLAGC